MPYLKKELKGKMYLKKLKSYYELKIVFKIIDALNDLYVPRCVGLYTAYYPDCSIYDEGKDYEGNMYYYLH